MKEFNEIINGKQQGDNGDGSDNQIPSQNDNSDNSEPGKDKNEPPIKNQKPTIPDGENKNNDHQKPNDKGKDNNKDEKPDD